MAESIIACSDYKNNHEYWNCVSILMRGKVRAFLVDVEDYEMAISSQWSDCNGYVTRKETVSYRKRTRITFHRVLFDNPEAAARAYNKAAIKYFGEFAYINEVN